MILKKEVWTKEDIPDFQDYLKTFKSDKNREWSEALLKTELPILTMKMPVIKEISNEIYKGNYISFLDLMIWEYYENTAINGFTINKIKDFNIKKKYLDIYSNKADNWATCDLLKFDVKKNIKDYFDLSLKYLKSDKPFRRRIGLYILFDFIKIEDYIYKIFDKLDSLKEEDHYYVNMMGAWLLCECFIKKEKETLEYYKNNNTNKFIINKSIQKCRESRRVSVENKDLLVQYKK